ncbi:hypothetical protein AAFH68_34140 [Flavobacterium sp. CGRL1]
MALNYYERFVFTKLITGSFRIGVSQKLMTRALSKAENVDEDALAYKLMGNWNPNTITFQELILDEKSSDYLSKPYPFYLAYPIEGDIEDLGNSEDWSIEHKWDGIRSQTIVRDDEIYVWSRGEELVTDKYPEFKSFVGLIPNGTVIDAEILAFPDNQIGTFNDLQARIGRKTISVNLLEKVPVILKAYDILEWEGKDIRNLPYIERRKLLEDLYDEIKDLTRSFRLSERVSLTSWEDVAKERERAREMKSEGLMLKRNTSPYQVGRKKRRLVEMENRTSGN